MYGSKVYGWIHLYNEYNKALHDEVDVGVI